MARIGYGSAAALGLLAGAWTLPAHAQSITIDGRLSPAQTLTGPNYTIGANLGQQRGGNLFHSFGRFGVAAAETATFTGPAGITNVIGRVTGGNASTIAGTLRSTVVGANVMLINPAGIALTQGARIDVPGAFRISTADEVRFADGARFSATNPNASTLTHAPPVAFGFLGPAQPISITGATINAGGIGVAGGAVTISGSTLSAPGGEIRIAGTAGAGEVKLERGGPRSTVTSWAPVRIEAGATVSTTDFGGGPGGHVRIRGSDVQVSGAQVSSDSFGAEPAGHVRIRANSLRLDADGGISANSFGPGSAGSVGITTDGTLTLAGTGSVLTYIAADNFGGGHAGRVSIDAGTLSLSGLGGISADNWAGGNAGRVDVRAGAGGVLVEAGSADAYTYINALAIAQGDAGRIAITSASDVTVRATALGGLATIGVYNLSDGAPGTISIATPGSLTLHDAEVTAFSQGGNAGTLRFEARDIGLFGDTSVRASSQGGAGGRIDILAHGGLTLDGRGGQFAEVAQIDASGVGGNGLGIGIRAGSLTLMPGGAITTRVNGFGQAGDIDIDVAGTIAITGRDFVIPTGVFSGTSRFANDPNPLGQGGTIRIGASELRMQAGGSISASTRRGGLGGNVQVAVRGDAVLDASEIAAQTEFTFGESGAAGTVALEARNVTLTGGASISTDLSNAQGETGRIDITAREQLSLSGNSRISSAVSSNSVATGSGAAIRIGARQVVIADRSSINSSTAGIATGGAIRIDADSLALGDGGLISAATSGPGRGGSIAIDAATASIGANGQVTVATTGSGAAGSMTLNIPGALVIDGRGAGAGLEASTAHGGGDGGAIVVRAGRIGLFNGGQIISDTQGSGRGGTIDVRATDLIDIRDTRFSTQFTGIGARSQAGATGGAGDITVGAPTVLIGRFGEIASDTLGSGGAGAVTLDVGNLTVRDFGAVTSDAVSGTGAGGRVRILADSMTVERDGLVSSSTYGAGRAGDIDISVRGHLDVRGGFAAGGASVIGAVSAAGATGDAGNVAVEANSLEIGARGAISSATAGSGTGGQVQVVVGGQLSLNGEGDLALINAGTSGTGAGGSVDVRAGALLLQGGGQINAATIGPGDGGDVAVTVAGSLRIVGQAQAPGSVANGILTDAVAGSSGNAGTVTVRAGDIEIAAGGRIGSDAAGTGRGGSVTVTTTDLLLRDPRSAISAASTGPGDAGNVTVVAGRVAVTDDAVIASNTAGGGTGGRITVTADTLALASGGRITSQTEGAGDAGAITLAVGGAFTIDGGATETGVFAASRPGATGRGGAIGIAAHDVTVRDGAAILSETAGPGRAGDITIAARGSVELSDRSFGGIDSTRVSATTAGSGGGGDIVITAPALRIADTGKILSESAGPGDAGTIAISAGNLSLLGGARLSAATLAGGAGGDISVRVGGDVLVAGSNSAILATSSYTGNAGDILVVARNLFLRDGGSIATSASSVDGGNIRILIPRESGLLQLDNASITASVAGGAGGGGNIFIDPFATILNNSTIAANAFGGPGGNVTLQTTYLFASPTSSITASSTLGIQGSVVVNTTPVDPAGTLATLPSDLRAASAVLREACAVRSATSVASLVVGTPGGLPFSPEAALPSTYFAGRPLFDEATTPGGVAQALAPAAITPAVRCG
jgi:filamentous hemagglutinin family protein